MNSSMSGKVAIVTGASRGIGYRIVRRLWDAGAHVASVSRSSHGQNGEHAPGQATFKGYQADVSNPAEVERVVQEILTDFGSVDFLVNNAGITRDGMLMRMTDEQWNDVIRTNLTGPFLMTRALARTLMKSKQGRIINIGSVIGLTGNFGQANYAAAKAGLVGLTKTMAKELSSRAVTVNLVCPGFIETDMTQGIKEDVKKKYLGEIPLGRFGTPEDVVGLVAFLCSAEAGYITGQVISIDGGLAM